MARSRPPASSPQGCCCCCCCWYRHSSPNPHLTITTAPLRQRGLFSSRQPQLFRPPSAHSITLPPVEPTRALAGAIKRLLLRVHKQRQDGVREQPDTSTDHPEPAVGRVMALRAVSHTRTHTYTCTHTRVDVNKSSGSARKLFCVLTKLACHV